jgi:hypothetical protein
MATPIRSSSAAGTGLLAIFVDLDVEDRPGFRPFLAEDMFPPRRNIGLGPMASYDLLEGDGQQFLTLYVAPSLGDLYSTPYQGLRDQRGARDALYHQKFRNQARYVAAWTGPEIPPIEPEHFSSHLLVDRIELSVDVTQAFNMWFAGEYMPALAEIPGVASVRRYLAVEGTPANLVLQEVSDPSVTHDAAWIELRDRFSSATSGLYVRRISSGDTPDTAAM